MQQEHRLTALLLALALTACGGAETPINNVAGPDTNMLPDNFDATMPPTGEDAGNQQNTVETPPAPAACANPPANGALLAGQQFSGRGHELQIRNGTDGDAIIKIRDAETGRLVSSFFVAQGNSASMSGIPDGSYVFQYAFGTPLAEDCRSFVTITSADEFPGPESFVTERTDTGEGVQVRTARLSYTLYPVPEGNVHPTPIDPAAFNRD